MSERNLGYIYALLTVFCWVSFVLFFKLFDKSISPFEILAHRILWTFVVLGICMGASGGLPRAVTLLKTPRTRYLLLCSGALIALAWLFFVYAVCTDQIIANALGNFCAPILQMVFGFAIFGEHFGWRGRVSFALVIVALAIQIAAAGQIPILTLGTALSVSLYAVVRKIANVSSADGLMVETTLMLPFVLIYLALTPSHFGLNFNGLLLFLGGFITLVSLLFYNGATTRIDLHHLALIQYLMPVLTTALATLVYGEPLPLYKAISLAIIILAIAVTFIKFKQI